MLGWDSFPTRGAKLRIDDAPSTLVRRHTRYAAVYRDRTGQCAGATSREVRAGPARGMFRAALPTAARSWTQGGDRVASGRGQLADRCLQRRRHGCLRRGRSSLPRPISGFGSSLLSTWSLKPIDPIPEGPLRAAEPRVRKRCGQLALTSRSGGLSGARVRR